MARHFKNAIGKSRQEQIGEVHVVFKTHLDIGFTDFARNVVRRYLDDYIPAALKLARETRPHADRFVWTMGSWILYRYLEKATGRALRRMEEAIEEGDVHWHALPFTTHSELMDAELFREGLRYSQRLDARFARKTSAAKMTDVPGHTRAIVPLLAEYGVRLLHIGVNPASTVPDVPAAFVWRSERAEIVVLYEHGYGATTRLPGGMALSMNLTGDNLGPQNPQEIGRTYDRLRKQFPVATLVAGTLNRVADRVWSHRRDLPVVTSEIGDTWIHGAGTDPAKVANFRALCRLRSRWIATGKLEAGKKEDEAFAENLLLVAEHTWGMDIKTHLHDWRNYSPGSLRRVLLKPNFRAVIASWQEQRSYIEKAVRRLSPFLAREARKELSLLRVSSSRGKWRAIPLGKDFKLGPWTLQLAKDGSIQRLFRAGQSVLGADARHRLGSLAYQTFSADDYRRFYRQYNTLDCDWARRDFTKPGLPSHTSASHRPLATEIGLRSDNEVRVILRFPPRAIRVGAPSNCVIYMSAQSDGIDLRLEWQGKQANRMPEAFWLAFNSRMAGAGACFTKFGIPIDPLDVVKNGNRHLHAIDGTVAWDGFSITSLDAPLVAPGHPSLLNFNNSQPDLRAGMSFNLYNNIWGTNFPMWYSDDAIFRFQLRWTKPRPA